MTAGHHGWLQDTLAPYLPPSLAELLLNMVSAVKHKHNLHFLLDQLLLA